MGRPRRWTTRNPLGYEQAAPRDWRAQLAEASARQMARLMGKPEKPIVETKRRKRSREQFDETQRLVAAREIGQHGFYVRLRYGVVIETGRLSQDLGVVRDARGHTP